MQGRAHIEKTYQKHNKKVLSLESTRQQKHWERQKHTEKRIRYRDKWHGDGMEGTARGSKIGGLGMI